MVHTETVKLEFHEILKYLDRLMKCDLMLHLMGLQALNGVFKEIFLSFLHIML